MWKRWKEQLLSLLKQNEEEHIEELREKYNPDNIFNNGKTYLNNQPHNSINYGINDKETTAMVEKKKESIIKK